MSDAGWPSEWQRGVLGLAVLSIIAEGENYGYLIAQRLEAAGLGVVKGGTLYPLLNRYESRGLLCSAWHGGDGGPGRKVFSLTLEGRGELQRLRENWRMFSRAANTLIEGRERAQ